MTGAVIRLMLVDDHEMVAQSLRIILEQEADIDVVAVATSVAEAVDAATVHRPEVVLMDYYLPDGDGVSLATRIKTIDPAIKIILLTGSDDPQALRRAVEAGCVGYLDKLGSLEELASAVRAAATGHVVISADHLTQLLPGRDNALTELTKREREILYLITDGLTNQAIAERLVLSIHTVRTHVQTILAKLGAHSKLEAVAVAKRRRLLG
jgi:DNA-binding NarL/FixJ family response regulator